MPPPFDINAHVARHGTGLRLLAIELVGDAATADDVVQETWLGALKSPPRHDAAIGGWLATLLRNVVRGRRREQRRRVRREEAVAAARGVAGDDHAESIARGDVVRELIAAVEALEPPYRDTIWQRFFEGKAPRDIAAATGVPVETVKSWLKRALATLRERLGERDGVDWRAGCVAAFGLAEDGTVAMSAASVAAGGVLMATWTKVASGLFATAAGIAVVVWWAGEPPPREMTSRAGDNATRVAAATPQDVALPAERQAVADASQAVPDAPVAAAPVQQGTIRGRAVDSATKEPLAGVRAKLTSGKVDANAADPEQLTGGDGTFEFAVRAGSKPNVYLRRDDRVETSCESLLVPAGHVEQVGDVAMRSGRVLRGHLVADDGSPIPRQTFVAIKFETVHGDGRRETNGAAYTAADGAFGSRAAIPFGPTTWEIPFGEFELRPPVQLAIGEAEPAEVLLRATRRQSIRGIVVDETGQPIAGVGFADQPMPGGGAKSDADGRFTVLRMVRGDTLVGTVHFTELPGCEPHAPIVDVPWGTADLRVVVKRLRPFLLEVVDEQGAPVEDFGVALQRPGLGFLSQQNVKQRGTHAGGKLAVDNVARGSTSLRVVPTSAEWTPSEPIPVGPSEDEPLRVVLQRRVPFAILVVSNGEPVRDVGVELLRERGGASASTSTAVEQKVDNVWMYGAAIEPITAGRTDAAGLVALLRDADLANCVLRTRLGAAPAGVVRDLVVPPPGEPLRVELPRHGRITGRVELRGRPRDAVRVVVQGFHPLLGRLEVGPDGAFELNNVQTGTHRVRLELMVGGRPATVDASEREVHVVAGEAANVMFDLADVALASLRGTVVAANPLPPGLIVDFRRHAGRGSEVCAWAEVGADGAFHVAELLPGTFHVAFRRKGASPLVAGLLSERLVIAAGEEAHPRLHYAPTRLVVKLLRPDGSVVRGERVLARCGGATWPEHAFLTPAVDEHLVLDPAPLLPVEFRGWNSGELWSAPVVMPPDRAELEVTVVLPEQKR